MDLQFSAEDEAFRLELRGWIAANLPEVRGGNGSEDDKLGVLHEGVGDWQRRLKWHRKLHEGGWVGLSWPKEYGGGGGGTNAPPLFRGGVGGGEAPTPVETPRVLVGRPRFVS